MAKEGENRFDKEEVWKDIAFLICFRPSPPQILRLEIRRLCR